MKITYSARSCEKNFTLVRQEHKCMENVQKRNYTFFIQLGRIIHTHKHKGFYRKIMKKS